MLLFSQFSLLQVVCCTYLGCLLLRFPLTFGLTFWQNSGERGKGKGASNHGSLLLLGISERERESCTPTKSTVYQIVIERIWSNLTRSIYEEVFRALVEPIIDFRLRKNRKQTTNVKMVISLNGKRTLVTCNTHMAQWVVRC